MNPEQLLQKILDAAFHEFIALGDDYVSLGKTSHIPITAEEHQYIEAFFERDTRMSRSQA